jgi:hypothetical protein
VHVHVPYLLPSRLGTAETTVVALPGRTAELEYRAPLLSFLHGALGPPPQKYPGLALTVVLLIIAMVLGICGCAALISPPGRGDGHAPPVSSGPASPASSPLRDRNTAEPSPRPS